MDQPTLKTIQKIAKQVSSRYSFAYYDKEDIEQEAFILALEGLESYSPQKGSLENFLYRHITNRLNNFIRDNYYRKDYKCPYCNNEDVNCENCIARKQKMETRKNLLSPLDIDRVNSNSEKNMSVEYNPLEELELNEVFLIINKELDIPLRVDYLKMLEGVYVQKSRREQIENRILEILSEHGYRK